MIREGFIYYSIRQQDGRIVVMRVKDTHEMRLYVEWVQAFEDDA